MKARAQQQVASEGWSSSWLRQNRLRQNWENQRRRPGFVVVNDVSGFNRPRSARLILAGIQVSIKSWEVAAGNLDPQFVPSQKYIARRPKIHADVIDRPGICQLRLPANCGSALRKSSVRFWANPFGQTSTNFPVKSVSTAELLTYRSSETGPVTSVLWMKAGVENTSTSSRLSAGRWSCGPMPAGSAQQQSGPPIVGTASFGS